MVTTLVEFVPLFGADGTMFSRLMTEGDLGAQVLFFTTAIGTTVALFGAIRPEPAK